jgi:3-oxoacyl-[acyl-carrier protein] reductase
LVDVTKADSIETMVKGALTTYGRIDVLVNNAGIVADAQLTRMTDEQFDKVIDVNLKGTYNCIKAVVEVMMERKSGVVLNASSIVGIYGGRAGSSRPAGQSGRDRKRVCLSCFR